jgi:aryl-alcohol dehydrogenase-like predicted oxidoreductase
MKALAVGKLVADGVAKAPELIRYAASFADTVIIGCSSKAEVRANVAASKLASRMNAEEFAALEARVQPSAERYDTFKA